MAPQITDRRKGTERLRAQSPLALTQSRGYTVSQSRYAIVYYDRCSSNDACLLDRDPLDPSYETMQWNTTQGDPCTVSYGNHAPKLGRPMS
jgi:hypothetical protein